MVNQDKRNINITLPSLEWRKFVVSLSFFRSILFSFFFLLILYFVWLFRMRISKPCTFIQCSNSKAVCHCFAYVHCVSFSRYVYQLFHFISIRIMFQAQFSQYAVDPETEKEFWMENTHFTDCVYVYALPFATDFAASMYRNERKLLGDKIHNGTEYSEHDSVLVFPFDSLFSLGVFFFWCCFCCFFCDHFN